MPLKLLNLVPISELQDLFNSDRLTKISCLIVEGEI